MKAVTQTQLNSTNTVIPTGSNFTKYIFACRTRDHLDHYIFIWQVINTGTFSLLICSDNST